MKILVVTPASAKSRKGNRVTAERWAGHLRQLGYQVEIAESYASPADMLIAIHAVKSADSISRFRSANPDRKIILILSGTDIYPKLNKTGHKSLQIANELVVLQPNALYEIPPNQLPKTHVILQSATKPTAHVRPLKSAFEITVVGHLRPVKDPFRAALAAKMLPDESRIKIVQIGAALSAAMQQRANMLTLAIRRYRWMGLQPQWKTKQRIARSRVMVISSKSEGGAGVIVESLVSGTPILASRVSGNVGMLGDDYRGYFKYRDTRQLRDLMLRCEEDQAFFQLLVRQCSKRIELCNPKHERDAIEKLMLGLS